MRKTTYYSDGVRLYEIRNYELWEIDLPLGKGRSWSINNYISTDTIRETCPPFWLQEGDVIPQGDGNYTVMEIRATGVKLRRGDGERLISTDYSIEQDLKDKPLLDWE